MLSTPALPTPPRLQPAGTALPPRFRLPSITPLAVILEIGLLLLVALIATSDFLDFDPNLRIFGFEAEYTTAVGYTITETFRNEGFIPYWQSYTASGDPAIDAWSNYTLNPFSGGPSFLYGNINGLKVSVVLAVMIAGLGGWALGRVIGFGWLARVVLGLLCIGKGNMYSMMAVGGYFQFLANQSYFPWIGAGIVSLFWLPHRRWPIPLLAISMLMLFFSGLIWFMMPILFVLGIVTLTHLFRVRVWRKDANGVWTNPFTWLDWMALRRLVLAGVLTLGLCMAMLLPLWTHRDNAPKQKLLGNDFIPLATTIDQFFNPNWNAHQELFEVVRTEAYNFVLPLWFGIFLAVLTIPLFFLYRSSPPKQWRLYFAAWLIVIFFVLWTAGLNPILSLIEQVVPLLRQFKHQWRVLSVAATWLSVIIAMHVNAAWIGFVREARWQQILRVHPVILLRSRQALGLILIGVCAVASQQIVYGWKTIPTLQAEPPLERACTNWLRQTKPAEYLSVWTGTYVSMTTYLRNKIRHWNIFSDFFPITPLKSTLFTQSYLSLLEPEYALAYGAEQDYARALGYSAEVDNGVNCPLGILFQRADALPYAFNVPLADLNSAGATLPKSITTTISAFENHHDRIALYFDSDLNREQVVVVNEAVYPGWIVEVNGAPAKLEAVGGLIGVIIPAGTGQQHIYFQYMAPQFQVGAWVTLFFAALTILITLRAERLIPARLSATVNREVTARWGRLSRDTRTFLLDDQVFEPRAERPRAPAPLLLPPTVKTPDQPSEISVEPAVDTITEVIAEAIPEGKSPVVMPDEPGIEKP